MINKINTLLSKINSKDINNFQNTLISVATYDNNLESALNTLYRTFFNKKANNNSFNYNLSKIANAKNPLTSKEKYQILSKFAQLFPTRELLLVVAKTAEDILKEKNNQESTINGNTDATYTPPNLTDQKTYPEVDLEGNPAAINKNDSFTDKTAGYTFAERDGLYDVINSKGEVVKSGLSLTAALKTIALTQEEKNEKNDQRNFESIPSSLLEAQLTKEKVNKRDTVQEVNTNTGVETEIKEVKEDRANDFSSTEFFDMFRKLDPETANVALEKIREKVSGETGAEAYNFLLKVKDNGWDFTSTYKETADGQSEQEVENERKEQSKKLARSIEKIIEEDAELSKMLNYKDYQGKKQEKTASLHRKAFYNQDLEFITNTGDDFDLMLMENDYAVSLINDSKKVETILDVNELNKSYQIDYNLASPIKWSLTASCNNFGMESLYAYIPEQDIMINFKVSVYNVEDEYGDPTEYEVELPVHINSLMDSNINLNDGKTLYLMDLKIYKSGKIFTDSFI